MSLMEYFNNSIRSIRSEAENLDANYVVRTNPEDLVQYFVQKHSLPLLLKDNSRGIQISKNSANYNEIPVTITYPIEPVEGVNKAAELTPSVYTSGGGVDLSYDPRQVAFVARVSIRIASNEGDKRINAALERIEERIKRLNMEIEQGNNRLKQEATSIVNDILKRREQEMAAFQSWIIKVPVKLDMRKDRQEIYELKVKEKIRPILPKPREQREPSLDRNQVGSIVSFIRNMGLSFERTPKVHSKLSEENLRDLLLSALNGVFEGEATGETFSKTGKTDIHLRVSKKDVLIAECKFWEGEKKYQDAIDQLFSYLTWREIYGILITFSKQKGFSEVIERAKLAALSHESCSVKSPTSVDESHFITHHASPQDPLRRIEVHHLLFNLFC